MKNQVHYFVPFDAADKELPEGYTEQSENRKKILG